MDSQFEDEIIEIRRYRKPRHKSLPPPNSGGNLLAAGGVGGTTPAAASSIQMNNYNDYKSPRAAHNFPPLMTPMIPPATPGGAAVMPFRGSHGSHGGAIIRPVVQMGGSVPFGFHGPAISRPMTSMFRDTPSSMMHKRSVHFNPLLEENEINEQEAVSKTRIFTKVNENLTRKRAPNLHMKPVKSILRTRPGPPPEASFRVN